MGKTLGTNHQLDYVNLDGDTGCWMSLFSSSSGGRYAKVRVGGRLIGHHVAVWESLNGPTPDGYIVGHRCYDHGAEDDRGRCVNPEHLVAETQQSNILRAKRIKREQKERAQ